jgi:hypothetical protein
MMKRLLYNADSTKSGNLFCIIWGHSHIWPLLSIYSVTFHGLFKWGWHRPRLLPWGWCCSAVLRDAFGERLILMEYWPLRTPDLSPSDFQLWGTMKALVHKDNLHSLHLLKEAITNIIKNPLPHAEFVRFFGNNIKQIEASAQVRRDHAQLSFNHN